MISDVLFDAIEEIERYQTDPLYSVCYEDLRPELDDLKRRMRSIQERLDTPPGPLLP